MAIDKMDICCQSHQLCPGAQPSVVTCYISQELKKKKKLSTHMHANTRRACVGTWTDAQIFFLHLLSPTTSVKI